ncbi:hypothetical protein YC2023_118160 [Brassica napus]
MKLCETWSGSGTYYFSLLISFELQQLEEKENVLATRSNEITEEDNHLGDKIRELEEELIRTKSGYFARESLSQLRMSINKSLVLSWDNNEDSEKETTYGDDVMELNKHVDKFYTYYDDDLRDSMLSTFASASCCEAESVKPALSQSPKIRSFRKSVAASTKFQASARNVEQVGPSLSKKPLSPTDSLAASLHRGMQPCDEAENLNASVKSLHEDRQKEIGSSNLLCLSCRQKLDHESEGGYKAIEEACTEEKHLKNMCAEQATKTEQLTCLLDQYKNNNAQEPSKLMKSDGGGDETEVVKETHETNQLSEMEALLKEIAELKSKLQPTKLTDTLRSSLLLRHFQIRKSTDLTKNAENNNDVLEEEHERWTEMESEWINLTDDLRMDIDSHHRHAEDLEIELKKEKISTEELNDALTRAMLEIADVKKATAKAAVKSRHGKHFAKAFSAELTAIRAEKEKEREFLKKENKGLKIQLRDTAEVVQAAGELLIRLREAEKYVQSSEERFRSIEEENGKLKMQVEKTGLVKEDEEHRTYVVSYDDYADDQAWRAEFGAMYQDHQY